MTYYKGSLPISKQKNSYKDETRSVNIRKNTYVPRRIYSEVIAYAVITAIAMVILACATSATLLFIQEAAQ